MQSEGALQMQDLPSALQYHRTSGGIERLSDAVEWDRDLPQVSLAPPSPVISVPDSERQAIGAALAATHGERAKAARILKIGRTTLYRKMKQYGFD